jgi:hypothetical protein
MLLKQDMLNGWESVAFTLSSELWIGLGKRE